MDGDATLTFLTQRTWFRVLVSKGSKLIELRQKFMVDIRQVALRIDGRAGRKIRRRAVYVNNFPEESGKFLNIFLAYRNTRCVAVTAVRKEQRFTAFQTLIDIEIGNAPPRSLADTILEADQYGWPSETIDHPRCNDTDDPGVPVGRGKNQRSYLSGFELVSDLFEKLIENHLLHSLSFPVESVQFPGQFISLRPILRQKEFYCYLRRGNATGCVDPGNQGEGSFTGIDHLVLHSGYHLQCTDTDPSVLCHKIQADSREYAVFVHKRRYVANGAKSNKIKVFLQIGIRVLLPETVLPQGASESDQES